MSKNINTMKKEELVKEIESKDKEMNELKANFEGQMAEMRNMIQMMLNNNQSNVVSNNSQDAYEDEILIGHMGFTPSVTLNSVDGEIEVYCNVAETPVSKEILKSLLRNRQYRSNFEKGVIFFADRENYKKYRVNSRANLSDEYFIEIMNKEKKDIIEYFNKITKNKTDDACMHHLQFRLAYLVKIKKLEFNMDIMNSFKEYFGVELAYSMRQLEILEL